MSFILQQKAFDKRREIFHRNFGIINHHYGNFHFTKDGEAPLNDIGLPDNGQGIYSRLLPLNDWIDLHKALDAPEEVGSNSVNTLVLGIVAMVTYPKIAMVLTVAEGILQAYDCVLCYKHGFNMTTITRSHIYKVISLLSIFALFSSINVLCKGRIALLGSKFRPLFKISRKKEIKIK